MLRYEDQFDSLYIYIYRHNLNITYKVVSFMWIDINYLTTIKSKVMFKIAFKNFQKNLKSRSSKEFGITVS